MKKGFTLIELLVVIAIIGIIATIILPLLVGTNRAAKKNATDTVVFIERVNRDYTISREDWIAETPQGSYVIEKKSDALSVVEDREHYAKTYEFRDIHYLFDIEVKEE